MIEVTLPTGRPALMGILNVTPDSFSDGGRFETLDSAVAHGLRMAEEGADMIDVGGESTRPGAVPVAADEEIRRVARVVERLAKENLVVSVDTSKASVARAALDVGASVVNDVTALSDPAMAPVCASTRCTVCLMHMQGEPRTMQQSPAYCDVVADVRDYLMNRAAWAESQCVARGRIWIDPGIGFGKTLAHNLEILRRLDRMVDAGYPLLVGVSRKSFIGRILGGETNPLPTEERLEGTLALQVLAQASGARIIRAHDVQASRRAIDATAALLQS